MRRNDPSRLLVLRPEVAAALAAGTGVVALESSIITHGMPYPENVETALAVCEEVRKHGAVPATVAVLEGRLCVGVTEDQIERLGRTGATARKISRRDLALALARAESGGTTVAATMIAAQMAGVRVFATGGIGGVHRGAERSFDISADLLELARTPVAVVCSGFKAILDLAKTLEVLETHGVPVISYGTDELPGFYTRGTGFGVDARLDTPEEVAELMGVREHLGLQGGLVVANPIPSSHAMDRATVEGAIEAALAQARERGVGGKDLTPFLLGRIAEVTGTASLRANIELVLGNARLAGAVATVLAAAAGSEVGNEIGSSGGIRERG